MYRGDILNLLFFTVSKVMCEIGKFFGKILYQKIIIANIL